MHILKSRSTIILGFICLVAILFTLATSDWLTFFAITHGITSVKVLGDIQLTLNIVAFIFSAVCFLSGIFLLFRSIFLLICRLLRKQGTFLQVRDVFIRAIIMLFVSTVICSHHLLYKVAWPVHLENSEIFELPAVAGDYWHGDGYCGWGVNIYSNGTYHYSYTGCEGLYEESSGTAKMLMVI
jgi:hypothetical protein